MLRSQLCVARWTKARRASLNCPEKTEPSMSGCEQGGDGVTIRQQAKNGKKRCIV
jgi:hypothetical protein